MSNHHDEEVRAHVAEIARAAASKAPPLAELRTRVTHRRRRRVIRSAAAVAGVAAVIVAVGWVTLSLQSDAPNQDIATDPSPIIAVPTYPQGMGGDEALLRGEFRFTESRGCPYVLSPGEAEPEQPIYLNFPPGYTGHLNARGKREIHDLKGNVIAVEGQQVNVGGGASGPLSHEWQPQCHPDKPQYIVTSIKRADSDDRPKRSRG